MSTILIDGHRHLPPPRWCRYCSMHLRFVPTVGPFGRWVTDDAYGELHCPYGVEGDRYHAAEHNMGWDQT